jgi:hypothetical protein
MNVVCAILPCQLYLTYITFNEELIPSGNFPVRLLFPRNLNWAQFKIIKYTHLLNTGSYEQIDVKKEFLTKN